MLGSLIMTRYAKQQTRTDQPTEAGEPEFYPKTPLGRQLWELRKQIVASGEPLLDREDLEREIAERRAECLWPCTSGQDSSIMGLPVGESNG